MFKKSLSNENYGVLYLPNGDKFVSGKGKFATLIKKKDGKVLEGEFWGRKLHGWGATRNLDPQNTTNKYIGFFKCGRRDGEGRMNFHDGIYDGNWRNNKRFGQGIMWYNDGAIYLGEWHDDKFHGYGVLIQANGNRFEGAFSNNLKNGEGIFYHKNTGQIQRGIWLDDICKSSVMEDDETRSQIALNPTPYPIPELKLENPERVVCKTFQHVTQSSSSKF